MNGYFQHIKLLDFWKANAASCATARNLLTIIEKKSDVAELVKILKMLVEKNSSNGASFHLPECFCGYKYCEYSTAPKEL